MYRSFFRKKERDKKMGKRQVMNEDYLYMYFPHFWLKF